MNERIVQRGGLYHCADCGETLRVIVVQLERTLRAGNLVDDPIAYYIRRSADTAIVLCGNCGHELGEEGGGGHREVKRALLHNEAMTERMP